MAEACTFVERNLNAFAAYVGAPDRSRQQFAQIESHVSDCGECASILASCIRLQPDVPYHATAWRPLGWCAAAASLLVAVGLAWAVLPSRMGAGRIDPIVTALLAGSGERFGVGERIRSSREGVLFLGDGSSVGVSSDTVIRLCEPGPGERLRLSLEAGTARFDVSKRPGCVLIQSPVGSVRVVGTRFRVRLWPRWSSGAEGDAGPCLMEVHVAEGCVEVGNGREAAIPVERYEVGYVLASPFADAGLFKDREVPCTPFWARRAADQLESALRSGHPGKVAIQMAVLSRQGALGVAEVPARIRDRNRPIPDRLAWVRVLHSLGSVEARSALGSLSESVGGEAPELVAALQRAVESSGR